MVYGTGEATETSFRNINIVPSYPYSSMGYPLAIFIFHEHSLSCVCFFRTVEHLKYVIKGNDQIIEKIMCRGTPEFRLIVLTSLKIDKTIICD